MNSDSRGQRSVVAATTFAAAVAAAACGDDGRATTTATSSASAALTQASGDPTTGVSAGEVTGESGATDPSAGATTTGAGTSASASESTSASTTSTTTTGGGMDGDGFLRVDPDHPRWLHVDGEGPMFICGPGDPEDFLYRGALLPDGTRDGDQAALIAKLAPTGANAIYLEAVRSHGGDGDATHNPFVDHDPAKGLAPAVLDQWEGWFTAMNDAGIVVYFFIYDDSALVWATGDAVGGDEEAFVGALVDRFQELPLLVWVIAEEYGEALSPARASALAAIVRERDERGHPIAIHQNHGLTFDFADDPNLDLFAIQYNVDSADALRDGVATAFTAADGAYSLTLAEAANWGSGATHRRKAWASATAGAYVMVLGMDVASTPEEDLRACGRLVELFRATPSFVDMAPRDDLSTVAGAYVFADPGRSYLVYSPASNSLGVRALVPGTYDLRWLDPAGGAVVDESVEVAGDEATWPRPPTIGAEAALAIVRRP